MCQIQVQHSAQAVVGTQFARLTPILYAETEEKQQHEDLGTVSSAPITRIWTLAARSTGLSTTTPDLERRSFIKYKPHYHRRHWLIAQHPFTPLRFLIEPRFCAGMHICVHTPNTYIHTQVDAKPISLRKL